MEKFNRSLALCGIAAAFCLGSCISVTDELDLDKKISLDVQVAPGGLSIPVGSLKEILIDSLIKVDGDNSELDILKDGLYGFSKEGNIDDVKVDIDQVSIKIPSPKINSITTSGRILNFREELCIIIIFRGTIRSQLENLFV